MKTVLVALNARYYHMNLAVRSLAAACQAQGLDVAWWEGTIDMPRATLLRQLVALEADCIGFSCYLWNIELVEALAAELKLVQPGVHILLGGPEVSFDAAECLCRNPAVDAILKGECEETLPQYLRDPEAGIQGLVRRSEGTVAEDARHGIVEKLTTIPFAYGNTELAQAQDRIVYYETTRGCPFSCTYCLSSRTPGVRALPLPRVKEELSQFVAAAVPLVKLVDRTFNADEARCREIMEIILALGGHTQFHFEVAGHLLTPETLSLLARAPKGIFRLEIGVQTTDEGVLQAIQRRTDTQKLEANVRTLLASGRTEVHLDLIAGLPGEDLQTFARSFDRVFALQPDMLQLGFLKLLRGCAIRADAAAHGYAASSLPPYEVISNDALSYADLCDIKDVCWALDKLYNAAGARTTLRYLLEGQESPFAVLLSLGKRYHEAGALRLSYDGLLRLVYDEGCARGLDETRLRMYLRFDHRLKERRLGAEFLQQPLSPLDTQACKELVRATENAAYADLFEEDVVAYWQTGARILTPCYVAFDGKGAVAGQKCMDPQEMR